MLSALADLSSPHLFFPLYPPQTEWFVIPVIWFLKLILDGMNLKTESVNSEP